MVERRKPSSPWLDYAWSAVAVLSEPPATAAWATLGDGRFYAGSLTLSLHTSETEHYRTNLTSGEPKLWVVLRPERAEPPIPIVHVTADPFEGEAYSETATEQVDSVPMPTDLAGILAEFIATHHVERPFFKRKRDRPGVDAREPDGMGDDE